MPRKKKQDRILTDRGRKLFRKHIPDSELGFGVGFTLFVLVMAVWFVYQEDNYDPGERDIAPELMVAGSVEDKLYRTPLQRWVDPSQRGVAQAAVDTGILPDEILEGGWLPSTRPQEFVEDNLFEKINGQAPQYISYGFQKLHYLGLEHPESGKEISIEFYDMGNFQNALGIFSAQRGDQEVLTAENAYYYQTAIGAIGLSGPFYFKFAGTELNDELTIAKAESMVPVVASMDRAQIYKPVAFTAFADTLGIPFSGISYVTEDVFQYDFAKNFWFGTPGEADSMEYYLHEARDEAEAAALFDKLLENHLYDYERVGEEIDGSVTLKHQFLDEYLVMERRGSMIYGLDGAPVLDAIDDEMGKLESGLFSESM